MTTFVKLVVHVPKKGETFDQLLTKKTDALEIIQCLYLCPSRYLCLGENNSLITTTALCTV